MVSPGYASAMDARPPASAYAAAIGVTFAFGLSFVATKTALRGFEPLLLALLRFALAGGILWAVWRLRPQREQVTRRELGRRAARCPSRAAVGICVADSISGSTSQLRTIRNRVRTLHRPTFT